jgi:hypothetical protein
MATPNAIPKAKLFTFFICYLICKTANIRLYTFHNITISKEAKVFKYAGFIPALQIHFGMPAL